MAACEPPAETLSPHIESKDPEEHGAKGDALASSWSTGIISRATHHLHLKSSTIANGSADHGRKRFSVNFVFCPGFTSTRT